MVFHVDSLEQVLDNIHNVFFWEFE